MGLIWGPIGENSTTTTTGHLTEDCAILTGISQTTGESSAACWDEENPNEQILPPPNLRRIFTFSKLKAATRNFRADRVVGEGGQVFGGCFNEKVTARSGADRVVGEGGFGQVFRGGLNEKVTARSGTKAVIAVKRCEENPNAQILPPPNLRIFTFSELKAATRNFRAHRVVGEGVFGKVFRGCLNEREPARSGTKSVIAVKRLKFEFQGFKQWQAEVNLCGGLSHPNLVKLLGYCSEDKKRLLIYEFMQKGSLENRLLGRGSTVQPLPWDIRLKIAIGAARGMAFLHTLEKPVIHRDIKPSNILLDGSYTAKISNLGLATLGPLDSQSYVDTQVLGTRGYAAPEYLARGHLYIKSDVYGFGVVLVEILTGLRAVDTNRPNGQHNLVDWIKPHLSDIRNLKNIMDSRLEGRYPSKAAVQTAQLSLKCLESEPKNRPSMKKVVEILERMEAEPSNISNEWYTCGGPPLLGSAVSKLPCLG